MGDESGHGANLKGPVKEYKSIPNEDVLIIPGRKLNEGLGAENLGEAGQDIGRLQFPKDHAF